jgi:ribosome-associated protein
MSKKIKQEISYSEQLSQCIVEGMKENKAKDITVLDLRETGSSVCDFFVLCSGDSTTHVDGITNALKRYTRKTMKEKPWKAEGERNSEWVLLDYVDVVAHVFYKDARSFYELEELWSDAKRQDIPNLT